MNMVAAANMRASQKFKIQRPMTNRRISHFTSHYKRGRSNRIIFCDIFLWLWLWLWRDISKSWATAPCGRRLCILIHFPFSSQTDSEWIIEVDQDPRSRIVVVHDRPLSRVLLLPDNIVVEYWYCFFSDFFLVSRWFWIWKILSVRVTVGILKPLTTKILLIAHRMLWILQQIHTVHKT